MGNGSDLWKKLYFTKVYDLLYLYFMYKLNYLFKFVKV